MTDMATIILAAGKGTRMKSAIPKILHPLLGKPLLWYPLQLATAIGSRRIVVVVGHHRQAVVSAVTGWEIPGIAFAHQKQQMGTGHAVMSALPGLKGYRGAVLILCGDVPLMEKKTLDRLRRGFEKTGGPLSFITFTPPDPAGYGRVIHENGRVSAIREHRDCSAEEKRIHVVNSGVYMVTADFLREATRRLNRDNSQGEFYLTDLVELAAKDGRVTTLDADADEMAGVNDRLDLARLEAVLQTRITRRLMAHGVSISRPETVLIEATCRIGVDTTVGAGVHLYGTTRIGKGCVIEPGVIIHDSRIADGAVIRAYSVLDDAQVGPEAQVGPMARLRPGAVLKRRSRVGNWVELKKTVLGEGSKANHLAYLGDGIVGDNVNLGAGCIFCNYDGYLKHQTVIEDDVFVGSDSQIVAPVTVGRGAYVASGSTVVSDVPPGDLAISRVRQMNKRGYGRLLRERLKARKAATKSTGKASG